MHRVVKVAAAVAGILLLPSIVSAQSTIAGDCGGRVAAKAAILRRACHRAHLLHFSNSSRMTLDCRSLTWISLPS
jgi:hypothetical protein